MYMNSLREQHKNTIQDIAGQNINAKTTISYVE